MNNTLSNCLLILLFLGAAPLEAKSPTGTWKWSSDINGQTINSVLRLETDGDKVIGIYSDQNIEEKIEDGILKGDVVTFNMTTNVDGTDIYVEWEGKVGDDAIEGSIDIEAGGQQMSDIEWSAKRYVGPRDVVGTWNFEFTAADGNDYTPVLKVTDNGGKLSAAFQGEDDGKVENLKLADNTLSFDITLDYNGMDLELTYTCKPRGNQLTGTIDYSVDGNTGEFDIKAKRKVLAMALRPMIGVWDFTLETPDGVTENPILSISDNGGELAAKLQNDGEEYQLKSVSVKNGELSFEFTADHDGNKLDLTWKSKLSGEGAMKGTVEFDIGGESGIIETSGKRR